MLAWISYRRRLSGTWQHHEERPLHAAPRRPKQHPMPEHVEPTLESVVEDFLLFDDWSDRYAYLIELGETAFEKDDALRTADNLVQGCLSQVWVDGACVDGVMQYRADSDAHIVRGLTALTLMMFNGHKPKDVLAFDPGPTLERLQLRQHLSPGRSNGLSAMIARIKSRAEFSLASR